MKFQTVFSFLFVGISFADAGSFGKKKLGEPTCALFDTIRMEGGAEFVNTEGLFPSITTGDMSIGERYEGVGGVTQDGFESIKITYKSVCIITSDQNPPTDISSPTCFYEFEMVFCPRFQDVVKADLLRMVQDLVTFKLLEVVKVFSEPLERLEHRPLLQLKLLTQQLEIS